MDRDILYEGQIGLVDNFLDAFKASMIGIAATGEAILGQSTQVAGLACAALSSGAVSGSAFAVQIGRGFIFAFEETDPNSYSLLGTDTATSILKTGINLSSVNLGLTNAAPATAGFAVDYLISAAFSEVDTNQQSIPFYNGTAEPTITLLNGTRTQRVVFQVTAGGAATNGTQVPPSTPSGYVPLYVVTVINGDTSVVAGHIYTAAGAPFIPQLSNLLTEAEAIALLGNLNSASIIRSGSVINYTPEMFGAFTEFAGTSAPTINLLDPATYPGKVAIMYNFSPYVGAVVTPAASIYQPLGGGLTSMPIFPYQIMFLYSDGVNWNVFGPAYVSGTPGRYVHTDGFFEQWFVASGTGPSAVTVTMPYGYQTSIANGVAVDQGTGGLAFGLSWGVSKTQVVVQPPSGLGGGTAWSTLVTVKGK